jgi:hypothetical protein
VNETSHGNEGELEHMRISPTNEQGSAKVVVIIVVILLAIAGYVAIQLAPMHWDYANFEKRVRESAISRLVPPFTDVEATVRNDIAGLLDAMGATYEKDHIKVEVSEDNRTIHVEVWYSRKHSLPLYQNPKQFYTKFDYTTMLPKTLNIPKRTALPDVD